LLGLSLYEDSNLHQSPSPHFSGVNLAYTTQRRRYTGPQKLEIQLTGGAKISSLNEWNKN
jgi:hypothetical protein